MMLSFSIEYRPNVRLRALHRGIYKSCSHWQTLGNTINHEFGWNKHHTQNQNLDKQAEKNFTVLSTTFEVSPWQ